MKINTKIMFLVGTFLVITSLAIGAVSIWQIKKNGNSAIERIEKLGTKEITKIKSEEEGYRQELLAYKKEYIKSQVQTATSVLEKAYNDTHDVQRLKAVFQTPLQNAVNTAFGILNAVDKEEDLTLIEKQQKALDLIKALRYGPDNKDYFWINDMYPKMVMHPYKPELDGKDLSDNKDPNGKRLFVEFVKVCREKGEGFVDYHWPKYGSDKPQPKLSYVKLFKQWNWVIGTGVYLEVAEEKLKADAAAIIKSLKYGPDSKDYFWINDMYPKMVMHPYKPELDGKDLSDNKDPNGKRLFVEFVKVCREKGEGFVDYHWPKYGADKPQPKLSYVKHFKQWNWVIGTGLYIDGIEQKVLLRKQELQKNLQMATAKIQGEIEAIKSQIKENIRNVYMLIGAITIVLLSVVFSVAFFVSKRIISNPIMSVVRRLNTSADQVACSSGQVSSASQSLAEGASEQAASIEETSSSLDEMSSMTRQNAENSNQAKRVMDEAKEIVNEASDSMAEMNKSMEEISKVSKETSKIIKTIDEIAFQTNLLALNAAVEAARAGEAGAGFAVVADEVRNLAMRAAEAAENTALLIEDTTKKVNEGSELVSNTDGAFSRVAESANKVAELVSEIAAASKEQAQGIDQVNKAVAEINRVTQQNSANAEESASAYEEMNAQAEQMKVIVVELVDMVSGRSNQKAAGNTSKLNIMGTAKFREDHKNLADHEEKDKTRDITPRHSKEVSPEQVIPLDNDFKDF